MTFDFLLLVKPKYPKAFEKCNQYFVARDKVHVASEQTDYINWINPLELDFFFDEQRIIGEVGYTGSRWFVRVFEADGRSGYQDDTIRYLRFRSPSSTLAERIFHSRTEIRKRESMTQEITLNDSEGNFIRGAFIEADHLPELILWQGGYFTRTYQAKYQEAKLYITGGDLSSATVPPEPSFSEPQVKELLAGLLKVLEEKAHWYSPNESVLLSDIRTTFNNFFTKQ